MTNPLQNVKTFSDLVNYLEAELGWQFEDNTDFDELTFDFKPEELGLKAEASAAIHEIKQLRPLRSNQPWGIFFVEFAPKKLPVVALRKILRSLVIKKRSTAKSAKQAAWEMNDLLFISRYGMENDRQITLANFTDGNTRRDLPILRVLGWDELDTKLSLLDVHKHLKDHLHWPEDPKNIEEWKNQWSGAFVKRHLEIINTTELLVKHLADLAKKIRERAKLVLSIETENGPLQKLFLSIQKTLLHDLNEEAFTDMYAQTISYGLFSAAVARAMPSNEGSTVQADNLIDMIPVTNPFLREMLSAFLTVSGRTDAVDFDELGIYEIVELLNSPKTDIGAIVRNFRDRRKEEDPVIHFYEKFLEQYDKKQKTERGVFYTPYQVVSYIVRSVHELLQTEFGLEDGLADITTWDELLAKRKDIKLPESVKTADPFVTILDPATGTATFLVEVIEVIYQTMSEKWKRENKKEKERQKKWNDYVPKHLLPRLYGYELKMAPYVIAHMTIDMKLKETGYDFNGTQQTNIFLTNTLEPPSNLAVKDAADLFGALAEEARKVNDVKKNKHFTVVIGNPPYSGISMNNGQWITGLIEEYKYVDGVHFKERKHWLSDDYVKFIRFGQKLISKIGVGVLAYITNHSFIDNPTFRGMRWNLMNCFNKINIIDLHGNTKKKEVTPDGDKDENVFDIQQGVSINIFLKNNHKEDKTVAGIFHHNLYGKRQDKYAYLLANRLTTVPFVQAKPNPPFFFMVPKNENNKDEYERGFSAMELFKENSVGIVTGNDTLNISYSQNDQLDKINDLLTLTEKTWREKYDRAKDSTSWAYLSAKKEIDNIENESFICISYRPFDTRWTYYTGKSGGIYSRPLYKVMKHFLKGNNVGLITARSNKSETCDHFYITKNICETKCGERTVQSCVFPLYLYHDQSSLLKTVRTPNLDEKIVEKIAQMIGLEFESEKSGGSRKFAPLDLFDYIYAVLHSPVYRERYKEFLKIDFPRVPYPLNAQLFWELGRQGGELRRLHLMEGVVPREGLASYDANNNNHIEKPEYKNDKVWINKNQYFDHVPQEAWDFYIGGYQPAHKWLKDRKGRTLSTEDITHYQKIILVLFETIRLMGEIDSVISTHGGFPDAFTGDTG